MNKEGLSDLNLKKWLIKTRREFHQHPELGFQEKWTTARIAEILAYLNIDVQLFDDMTGVVGLLRFSDGYGPCIGLRADIDALPIEETNNTAYKSLNPSVMHACGHDAHITMMLGVAKKLSEFLNKKNTCQSSGDVFKGSVKFLFQPAEENGPGSQPMIDRGALKNPDVDRILACHVTSSLPSGKVAVPKENAYSSGDSLEITITGRGGHASAPHVTRDPITAGARLINALQTIVSRDIDPIEPAVIAIGSFHAGTAGNVTPEKAVLRGTIRALAHEVREQLHKRIRQVAEGIGSTMRVKVKVTIIKGYPPTINDPEIAKSLYLASTKIVGRENVQWAKPSPGAEDFSFFAMAKPSAIMWIGTGSKKYSAFMHSPDFDIDEKALEIGVDIITQAVSDYLKDKS